MNLKQHYFTVGFVIEMDGKDLNVLQALSQRHYDGKCKAASEQGGFLYGMFNRHNFKANACHKRDDLPAYDPANQPTRYLEDVTEHHLTWDEVDTLAKISELERYAPRTAGFKTFTGRNFALMQMLKSARHTSEALNTDQGRTAVESLSLSHFAKKLGVQ